MTGNLWEWVAGTYSEENPWPLIKGGSYKKGALFASCYARFTQNPEARSDSVGFRCCADAELPVQPEYGQGCAEKPGTVIPDDLLALKQDAAVNFILYVAPHSYSRNSAGGNSNPASARAVVVKNSGEAQLITHASQSKENWIQAILDAESAKNIENAFSSWSESISGPPLASTFWNCAGTRIYAFYREKEYWLNANEFLTSQPSQPVLMEIADKVLKLPAE